MNVFELRQRLTRDYASYASSFIAIYDERLKELVADHLKHEAFWPAPLIQLNPAFESGGDIQALVREGLLHPTCAKIFKLQLHRHQYEAVLAARKGQHYILTTGTGSGKSLSYIVPIVDHVLRHGSGKGIQAIIVYPMNALANSQKGELEKFLGKPDGQRKLPVTFARYTGQESSEEREAILNQPPDILLTNYVMLELIMTRPRERRLIQQAQGLRFLVLDELHTYRGRQGADVALLLRRVRNRLETPGQPILFVGTSATLASEGTYEEQRRQVAETGKTLFGVEVLPENVIGETLQRTTSRPEKEAHFHQALRQALNAPEGLIPPQTYADFVAHPLSVWLEETFGLREVEGRLLRQKPTSIRGQGGAALKLSQITDLAPEKCAQAIEDWLLAGYQHTQPHPQTGRRPFVFRLHQFISPGDTIYASLEAETERYATLQAQQFVPHDRQRLLLPLCFCRECGQEYYSVRFFEDRDAKQKWVEGRDFSDRLDEAENAVGYLYLSSNKPWPQDETELLERLPENWLEERNGKIKVRSDRKRRLPQHLRLKTDGQVAPDGIECVFIPHPFQFCLRCGVSYSARQGDFAKLATLSSEGRSSATTLLSLSAILALKTSDLPQHAQKLLSFTDNRQDASLQAGHFNDFVEVGLLRGAIYRAVQSADRGGLSHDLIAEHVFQALNLPLDFYASDPDVRFGRQDIESALKDVLGYRLYRDLRRGWRISLPNLEQCGLLEIDYQYLDEVCQAKELWQDVHPALTSASPSTRRRVAKVLLDYMRRELAIKVEYLEKNFQESLKKRSYQNLRPPWGFDEDERLEYASVLFPCASSAQEGDGHYTYLSGRSGFGLYLRRLDTFSEYRVKLDIDESETIIRQLLEILRAGRLVEVVIPAKKSGDVNGYQLLAQAMRWKAGAGETSFHDPIRIPRMPQGGGRVNPFFVNFYREVALNLLGFEAHEHTAQVPYQEREKREQVFRKGELPILYCSPTMELGVDIAELNVVNMRNVPPTPANYAQRSGRAGRSGQPALVFTYCASRSAHDQYFFKRPETMVAGAVTPPRLDLSNEDLIRAHIHAIWLAETGIDLKDSLKEILETQKIGDEEPSLALIQEIQQQAKDSDARERAYHRAQQVLADLPEAEKIEQFIDLSLQNVVQAFDAACDRWRNLYRSAQKQAETQEQIRRDPARSPQDKKLADRLRHEALAQFDLLTQADKLAQSDFYSYRYFASEGFLPGYNFPRLPISAFIPARRLNQADEFLSRPRFLAISEFGPRAIVYHEGSRYIINRVIMPVLADGEGLLTMQIKQCGRCGYIHRVRPDDNPDRCDRCQALLLPLLQALFKMENVVTRRRDRISADEEERLRLGYDIQTGLRFSQRSDNRPNQRQAEVIYEDEKLFTLTYAPTATLWRINLGWTRRKNKEQHGFILDMERGYWAKNDQLETDDDTPLSANTRRVIPYVEDSRNCLLFEPAKPIALEDMASLQAALKRAIETVFQLEDNELAAEPLPNPDTRHLLLFYESAEGGAGVLRQLVDNPQQLARVAEEALRLCHFDPESGEDLRHAPNAKEDCEAACYNCLLSYSNQREHRILDRMRVRDILHLLSKSQVQHSPSAQSRDFHLQTLFEQCDSDLEREWLNFLEQQGLRLPDHAQHFIEACRTRPDFLYNSQGIFAAIYIDGPQHDYPQRQKRDKQQSACMEDAGYIVLRFSYRQQWEQLIRDYHAIFGGLQ